MEPSLIRYKGSLLVNVQVSDGDITFPRWNGVIEYLDPEKFERKEVSMDLPEQTHLGLHWASHDADDYSWNREKKLGPYGLKWSMHEMNTLGFVDWRNKHWRRPELQELLHVHVACGEVYRRTFENYWVWGSYGDDPRSEKVRRDPASFCWEAVDLCTGEIRMALANETLFYRFVAPMGWWSK